METKCPLCSKSYTLSDTLVKKVSTDYKKAVYAFVNEHTKKSHDKTKFFCSFIYLDKFDLEKRIMARYNGYSREWTAPKLSELKQVKKEKYEKNFDKKRERVINEIKNRSFILKWILTFYGF